MKLTITMIDFQRGRHGFPSQGISPSLEVANLWIWAADTRDMKLGRDDASATSNCTGAGHFLLP